MDRFVDRPHALARPYHGFPGQKKRLTAEMTAQFLEVAGVNLRMFTGKIHFANHLRSTDGMRRRFCVHLRKEHRRDGRQEGEGEYASHS